MRNSRWRRHPGRGTSQQLAVLTPQTAKLLALHRRQAILAAALVTIGLASGSHGYLFLAFADTARTWWREKMQIANLMPDFTGFFR